MELICHGWPISTWSQNNFAVKLHSIRIGTHLSHTFSFISTIQSFLLKKKKEKAKNTQRNYFEIPHSLDILALQKWIFGILYIFSSDYTLRIQAKFALSIMLIENNRKS